MASADEQLPEGTDTIIEGAGVSEDREQDTAGEAPAAFGRADAGSGAGLGAGGDANIGGEGNGSAGGSSTSNGNEGGASALFDRFGDLRGQAGDKARDFAQAGKDRATTALDSLVQTVEDAAAEIDQKLGSQFGDYARRAAQGIGDFSDSFRDKDVDELFADARELIKRSPAIAVGTAAALGFVVARLARAGVDAGTPTNTDAPRT